MSSTSLFAVLRSLAVCLVASGVTGCASHGGGRETSPPRAHPATEPLQTQTPLPARGAPRVPLIGDKAPAFRAETTLGTVNFPEDYAGSWVVFFSHPGDFTPVCTTEFMTFADMQDDFAARNCYLLGLSEDSKPSHIAWLLRIEEKARYRNLEHVVIRFPVIADRNMEVARKYGMVHPRAATHGTIRAVYIIDPQARIRAMLCYPASTGRDINEIYRAVVALQASDRHEVSTPANWRPGEPVIEPPPGSCGTAAERIVAPPSELDCVDWFLCYRNLPVSELKPTGKGTEGQE